MNFEVSHLQLGKAGARLRTLLPWLAEPRRLMLLQRGVLVLLLIWGSHSVARLMWALWPAQTAPASAEVVINPGVSTQIRATQLQVDVDAMLGLGLFGDPADAAAVAVEPEPAEVDRAGIEDGARESKLDLTLTGIVASTEDGLGSAMIEAKGQQVLYVVGDKLPASGKVSLAKVMAQQVVIDNNGIYELLRLFEQSALSSVLEKAQAPTRKPAVRPAPTSRLNESGAVQVASPESSRLAAAYRDQLYDNPQSLAQVVKVSAVRGAEGLRGYRVAPGQDAEQFRTLGFKAGDIVTAVNGLPLSDPTNTMRLYQLMRDATDATFEVERGNDTLTIAVSLDGG